VNCKLRNSRRSKNIQRNKKGAKKEEEEREKNPGNHHVMKRHYTETLNYIFKSDMICAA